MITPLLAEHADLILVLLSASVVAGFAAGLFGIGGGAIIVPALYLVFRSLGYAETAMHTALATSLATIVLTSLRSVQSHHSRGAVDWSVLKNWGPSIIAGAFLGQVVAGQLPAESLALVFTVLAYLLSLQLLLGAPEWRLAHQLPVGWLRRGIGSGIGFLSTLMGIGGGVFGVTLMTAYGRPMHQAVGTAAGFGAAIGIPSALTAMASGHRNPDLPPLSIGFVNLIAFAMISTLTVAVAPLGVRVAHKLDARRLRQLFGLLLIWMATHILWTSIGP